MTKFMSVLELYLLFVHASLDSDVIAIVKWRKKEKRKIAGRWRNVLLLQ